MIGSAANSGQAMPAGLRGGAPAKGAGDAAPGTFDIVVAGLGASANGRRAAASPVPATEMPVDPVKTAEMMQDIATPPATVIAGPIPALPPQAPTESSPHLPVTATRGEMTDAGDKDDANQLDAASDADIAVDGAAPSVPVAPGPAIVHAAWSASVSRPVPVDVPDATLTDPPGSPQMPKATDGPAVNMSAAPVATASIAISAKPFVANELFSSPAGALGEVAAQPDVAGVDTNASFSPAAPRFTPLVAQQAPVFTPLAAMAQGPTVPATLPDDIELAGGDLSAGAPPDLAADISVPLAPNIPPLPTAQSSGNPTATVVAGPDIAQVVAGHQLDLARDSAWLDQLARDIVAAGANDAKLSFKLNPEHLGSLHVEILRGDDGASVRLTAENESARAALADAQGRLVAEARAHGMKIAETHVDLSQQGNGQGQRNWADGQSGQPNPQPQPARVNAPVTMSALDDEPADARTGPRERYA